MYQVKRIQNKCKYLHKKFPIQNQSFLLAKWGAGKAQYQQELFSTSFESGLEVGMSMAGIRQPCVRHGSEHFWFVFAIYFTK